MNNAEPFLIRVYKKVRTFVGICIIIPIIALASTKVEMVKRPEQGVRVP